MAWLTRETLARNVRAPTGGSPTSGLSFSPLWLSRLPYWRWPGNFRRRPYDWANYFFGGTLEIAAIVIGALVLSIIGRIAWEITRNRENHSTSADEKEWWDAIR